uniref:Uncharacterized protein n=1 Tax=Alexandrium andersonii TaxID=327968 RepID=A0A7S2HMW5_9DINO|mmetsp:Transcript_73209/g.163880  ORF Transcript_73209/g.163880 Transcript_73209/m.163880 type:complete len:299 (+) Transcript_73209:78-974(+)
MEPFQAAMGPPRPQNFHTVSLGLLVLLPTIVFLVISFFMVYLSHSAQVAIWVAVTIFFLISLIFMSARKQGVQNGPNFWMNLGLLCFLATLMATILGVYNWRSHAARYWAYVGQRHYTNVLPSEPALSHIDAGSISFSSDAHLDFASAGSYRDGDRVFCVAPVVGTAPQSVVNYWAAGVGCCREGGNFTCGSAQSSEARGGLTYLWAGRFASQSLGGFRHAAREAAQRRGLTSSKDALFLMWSDDLDLAQRAFWNDGIHFLVCSCAIYASVSLSIGAALHCCRRNPARSKLDDARLTY